MDRRRNGAWNGVAGVFALKEHGTRVSVEALAGVTTFFTTAYIIFVNPSILSQAGIPWRGAFIATILTISAGSLLIGLFANVPYVLAPGMGLNAFFAFTVCAGFGFAWQEALALVFLSGLVKLAVMSSPFRKRLFAAIPLQLQHAISGGIGAFIAYIGIKQAEFLRFTVDRGSIIAAWPREGGAGGGAGPLADSIGGLVASGGVVPSLANFTSPTSLVALAALIVTVILMVMKVRGAILIGILAGSALGIPFGLVDLSKAAIDTSTLGASFGEFGTTFGAAFGNPGILSLFAKPERIPLVFVTVLAFSLSDVFDMVGTFMGTGRGTGIFSDDDMRALESKPGLGSRLERSLIACSASTSIGAVMGTSNTTAYVESAAGIEAGGKTGLTALVISALFLVCILLAPVAGLVPAAATAPALIVIGVLMMGSFRHISWEPLEEALPAGLTVFMMAFSYSISNGIAAGFILHCVVRIAQGRAREVHPIMYGTSALFIVNFVVTSLLKV